jgi:hypothetical protein
MNTKKKKQRKPSVTIKISLNDLCIFRCSLAKQIKAIKQELDILLITRDRDLTMPERWQLPASLSAMSRENLCEQIDAWKSLYSTYEFWSNELENLNREAQ